MGVIIVFDARYGVGILEFSNGGIWHGKNHTKKIGMIFDENDYQI